MDILLKMAHFVAVCVVCVLCASHVPCYAHTSTNSRFIKNSDSAKYLSINPSYSENLVINQERTIQKHTKENSRSKRHADLNEKYFIKQLFQDFGDGENMNIEGFERLLKKIGLFQSVTRVPNDQHNHVNSNKSEKSIDSSNDSQNTKNNVQNKNITSKHKCLNSNELLKVLSHDVKLTSSSTSNNDSNTIIPDKLFERICPVLIYQLASVGAQEKSSTSCLYLTEDFDNKIDDHQVEEMSRNIFQVWMYSTISILIISLCGLLGVAVIPVMGKSYYHHLLQYLVALAVGTLCGDALIHLIPHAMMSHNHDHDSINENQDSHNLNMWKGFVAMIGLTLFFFTEKALNIIVEWRKYNKRQKQLPSRVRVMREHDEGNQNSVGEKLCKHKYSSYPYCYGEITDAKENHNSCQHNNHERPQTIEEEKPLTSKCNSVSKIVPNNIEKKNNEDWKMEEPRLNETKKNIDSSEAQLNELESYTVIIRDHETKHHGHSHSHSHVHSAPDSMSSVAWMVIMGDGLHNFTDGMAIGAAFSASIAGGFSTTIAVFCHELPHELGDFAVLLKAGMSAKQAVFYNLLSSVLCLFGMIFGVILGTTPSASSWMFAAAAGMFIYIALVDMIPELSTNHSTENGAHWICLLQALGLVTGFSIMLLIALYEHDLQNIFGE